MIGVLSYGANPQFRIVDGKTTAVTFEEPAAEAWKVEFKDLETGTVHTSRLCRVTDKYPLLYHYLARFYGSSKLHPKSSMGPACAYVPKGTTLKEAKESRKRVRKLLETMQPS